VENEKEIKRMIKEVVLITTEEEKQGVRMDRLSRQENVKKRLCILKSDRTGLERQIVLKRD
jgi:hypothetical protein